MQSINNLFAISIDSTEKINSLNGIKKIVSQILKNEYQEQKKY
jgi:hypothetical protein